MLKFQQKCVWIEWSVLMKPLHWTHITIVIEYLFPMQTNKTRFYLWCSKQFFFLSIFDWFSVVNYIAAFFLTIPIGFICNLNHFLWMFCVNIFENQFIRTKTIALILELCLIAKKKIKIFWLKCNKNKWLKQFSLF